MKMLDIVHPAAKTLCDISLAQDAEVGDGTTTVVILAGELLKEAKPFVEDGVHPQLIIKAYRQAAHKAVEYVRAAAINLGDKPREELRDLLEKCAQTSLNSKLVWVCDSVCDSVCVYESMWWMHAWLGHHPCMVGPCHLPIPCHQPTSSTHILVITLHPFAPTGEWGT